MTTVSSSSPFPRLSQAWRVARLFGVGFGAQAAAGVAHIAWSERTAVAAVAVAAAEAAYRQAFPAGRLSGQLASLVAAYRQITAASKPAEPSAAKPSEPETAPPASDTPAAA